MFACIGHLNAHVPMLVIGAAEGREVNFIAVDGISNFRKIAVRSVIFYIEV